mmetsp:Transcript_26006/g.53964  ORF Transcript_26006/g.53964 Transcript_26006/m.53964 type:complete len:237 (-) Transcript_26006:335-1045(-)
MAVSGIEQARFKGMLESLQLQDPEINQILVYSKFVVAYFLQQDEPNPGWRKANIEGPVYIVRRRTAPRYQLLVKNQLHMNDLLDSLHPDWELDCQKNYVFYKVQDTCKRIRGLWFHDDAERQKIESTLEKALEEIRNAPTEPQTEPMPAPPEPKPPINQPEPAPPAPTISAADNVQSGGQVDLLYTQFGLTSPGEGAPQETVTISMASVRSALHALADDDTFLKMVMQKLKSNQIQ